MTRKNKVPSHYVNYFLIDGDVRTEQKSNCFGRIYTTEKRLLEYHCDIDEFLTAEHINFWREFVNLILDKSLFTERLEKTWICTIRPSDFSCRPAALLYLTLFRYPQEFPEIIIETYKQHTGDWEATFINFQNNHKRPLKWKYCAPGHAVTELDIYNRRPSIFLADFKKKLKTNQDSVYMFFTKSS